ncbi:MAG TPA: tetratricopeptide repeat protein [Anaerolineales bacterium]|nr:tetratricopeptide repeat protein [Anaerolineales bacterium]
MRERRKILGLTQAGLGRLAACSKVMINKIEGGQRHPSLPLAVTLARSLKIPPKDRPAFLSLARPDLTPVQLAELIATFNRPGATPQERRVSGLPIPTLPIVGRAQEVAAIHTLLLDPDVRLVTLTGAGGVGKTRLSIQVALDLCGLFADGCRYVSLAALDASDLLIPTVARGLGIKETRGRTLDDALFYYLSDKDLLLILDNFEQILPAAKKVAEVLEAAPGLKILITSRTVLHLSGEYEFVVPPLRFVDAHNSLSNTDLVDSPAVKLFVQKARTVKADFALTPENAAEVARICAHLDGLPLAIELAASRSKFLSPAGLLARLEGAAPEDGPLDILTGGALDLPARQQAMRRTIDWSYDLLGNDERDLFRELAVFVGGCSAAAVAAVCRSDPRSLDARLASLVDQSMLLLVAHPEGESRYRMLESLRDYALERLARQPGEWAALRSRHAAYFMNLAESNESRFEGSGQVAWLDRLELEHDNLQAALAWCCSSGQDAGTGLRLAAAVWQFWLVRGYVGEGRRWFSRILERTPDAPIQSRARALNGAGFLDWAWGDYDRARSLLEAGLACCRELGDSHETAWVLNHLGHVALAQNRFEDAAALVRESLALFERLGATWNRAWDLLNLGDILQFEGDETQAIRYYRESLDLFRKIGEPRGTAWSLDHFGRLAYAHRDYERAAELLGESVQLFRSLGDKRSAAWVLAHLGDVASARGDPSQAGTLREESQALFRESGAIPGAGGVIGEA